MASGDLISSRGGIANYGTIGGGVTIEDGAMKFDGDGDYVNLGTVFNSLYNFSFGGWIKPAQVTPPAPSGFFVFGYGTNSRGLRTRVNTSSDNRVFILVGDGTSYEAFSFTSLTITDTNWHSLFYTVYPGISITACLDGVCETLPFTTITSMASPVGNSLIGSGNSITAEMLDGSIDDFVIFNRPLSQEEMITLHNQGRGSYSSITDGLVAQYSGRDYAGTEAAPTRIYNAIYTPNSSVKTFIDNMNLPNATDKLIVVPVEGRYNCYNAFGVCREA